MDLINTFSNFLCQRSYDNLPEPVVSSTKSRILDFLSVAFSGCERNIHKPVLQAFQTYNETGEATVIGEGVKLRCGDAAFVNSSMCSGDMADGARVAGLHPGPVVIPAVLATSEFLGKKRAVSGQDLIVAVSLGYEVMIRVGIAMNPSAVKRGFHLTSITGGLASTAAVGKITKLNEEEMANALSIACIWGAGLLAALKAPEPFSQMQVARACEMGIRSVSFAQSGVTGIEGILEEAFLPAFCDEYQLDLVAKDLGEDFMIPKTYVKMHAGCRHVHAPMDAACYIVNKHNLDWRDIEEIRVKTYSVALVSEIADPKTGEEAKFNMPFAIAVLLIYGDAFVDKFSTQNLQDQRIQNVMGKITVEHDPELDREFPAKRGTRVEMKTKDGRTLSHAIDIAKGEPENPYSKAEVEKKFDQLASWLMDSQTRQKTLEFINRLETIEDISHLFTWLGQRGGNPH